MDDDEDDTEARGGRGCRCCGTVLLAILLAAGFLLWSSYSRSQRMAEQLDTAELESTEEVEQFLAEQGIKVKKEDGEWKAEAPWNQEVVDRLRERFDELAGDERVQEARSRAEEAGEYLREMLSRAPDELQPHIEEIKEQFAYVTDQQTMHQTIDRLSQYDMQWVEQEAQRLLDSKPGEDLELYIEKLRAMFDNVDSEELRQRLGEQIEEQQQKLARGLELGELPEIDAETGELPVVLVYMEERGEQREPQQWSFVREVELDDGPAYSVEVSFSDGSITTYYIRSGEVVFSATRNLAEDTAGQ